MVKVRFSIRQILLLIGFAAVSIAALRNSSPIWASAVFSVTFLGLLLAVLAAIYGGGRRRAFWTGFALFGNAHLLTSMLFPTTTGLLTVRALIAAGPWLSPQPVVLTLDMIHSTPVSGSGYISGSTDYIVGSTNPVWVWPLTGPLGTALVPYLTIGNAVFSVLFGIIGGLTAIAFASRESSGGRNTPGRADSDVAESHGG